MKDKDSLEVEEFLLMGHLKRKEVEYFKTTWVERWVVLVPDKFLIYAKRGDTLAMKTLTINTDTMVSPAEELSGYADSFVIKQRDSATGKEIKKATEYFKAEDSGDMESWIKALLMALSLSLTRNAKRRTEVFNFNQLQPSVFSIRGLMCDEHMGRIENILKEFGIKKYYIDRERENIHINDKFDPMLLVDSVEQLGFLIYSREDIACLI